MKSTAWPSEWGRGTTHCARAFANTHLLVHIIRNCYKSTSCFQNCWFFLTLSYSYQRDPPHPKCDLTPSFLSFATHSGKNPIWRRNDSFILTKKCYVYIVDLRQRQFNTQGCFGSQRLRASGFRTGMSHNPGLHLPVRRAGWRWDSLEFFRTNDTFQNNCNATRWCHKSTESNPNKDSTD